MTVNLWNRRISLRFVTLVASVGWRHVREDPARAAARGWRILPGPCRGALRRLSRYSRALWLWERGDRQAALQLLEPWPRRQAVFALAMDRPDAARAALDRLHAQVVGAGPRPQAGSARIPAQPCGTGPGDPCPRCDPAPDDTGPRGTGPGGPRPRRDPAPPWLAARLAWREGRLNDAARLLEGARLPRARRMRRALAGELAVLSAPARPPATAARHRGAPRDRVPARVLHIVTNALPVTHAGYTVRTHRIAVAQRAAGLDPHVVTRCGFPVAQGKADARHRVDVDGITYHRLLPYVLPATADVALARGTELAARLAQRLRPAVLHAASNHLNGQVALATGARCGLPVVYEVRGFLEETWLSRRGEAAYATAPAEASDFYRMSRDMETHCMHAADLVVTLGDVMREEIISRGVPAAKVLVMPNAVAAEFLQPLPDGSARRAALGIGPTEFVIGMVSSLFAYEGGDTLLRAAAELRRRGVPARPLIVGDGPERPALERLASHLGLGGLAVFTGRVPMADVRHYHAVLDIFVVPRTDDRVCHLVTPLKPVEAMASGLCVVASEVKALREIIEPGITGELTLPEDPVTLADCAGDLFYSPDRRREIGARARDWAARDRTWARNADRYLSAYASVGAL